MKLVILENDQNQRITHGQGAVLAFVAREVWKDLEVEEKKTGRGHQARLSSAKNLDLILWGMSLV